MSAAAQLDDVGSIAVFELEQLFADSSQIIRGWLLGPFTAHPFLVDRQRRNRPQSTVLLLVESPAEADHHHFHVATSEGATEVESVVEPWPN
jgi:hypothetical protein